MATRSLLLNSAMRRYSRPYGSMEEVTVVLDAPSLLLLNADINQAVQLFAGDTVLSASAKVLVSGTATATLDIGTSATPLAFQAAVALDAAVNVVTASDLANPYTSLVDETIDFDTDVAEWVTGRMQVVFLIHRGSKARSQYEQYVGDPNNPPQA